MTSVADTRFLIVFRFPPSDNARQAVGELLRKELSKGILLPSIVVTEYLYVVGRKTGLSAALTHIAELERRGVEIVELSRGVAEEAGKLLLRHPRVPIADALIGASAMITHSTYVLSNDPHFQELGVKTKWF